MALVPIEDAWDDPGSAWWAKCARAEHHLGDLDGLVTAFRDAEPYTVTPEPTSTPDLIAYRLRIHHTPSAEISTTIGDILHNLRSALDALAYGIAVSVIGGPLSSTQERAVEFPICPTPEDFGAFFASPSRPERAAMFDARARAALHERQPFAISEHFGPGSESERRQRYVEDFRYSGLARLRHLNNIDKHRRLAMMGLWPSLLSWTATTEGARRYRRGDGTLADDSILCYLEGSDPGGSDLQHEFVLVLTDDRGHRPQDQGYSAADCTDLARWWHQQVETTIAQVIADMRREVDA